jgi:hypothetical protein
LGHVTAKRLAAIIQRFDQMVGEKRTWEAARDVLKEFTDGWDAKRLKGVPASGPLLVVANHPGSADSVAAMAAIKIELLDLSYDIGLIITFLGIKYCIK